MQSKELLGYYIISGSLALHLQLVDRLSTVTASPLSCTTIDLLYTNLMCAKVQVCRQK